MVKIYKQPFAHEGDAIAIPDVSQPNGKMSTADGWTPDYQLPSGDPNYKPVDRQEMNGVFKEVTEALGQMQVQGAATWSADGAPYPINAQVYHNDKQWIALRANSVEPDEGEDWSELSAAVINNKLDKSAVVQSTGTSITDIMSQKAVCDQLLGVGQAWQDVTASRGIGTTYTNTTGRTIMVSVIVTGNSAGSILSIDGVEVSRNDTGGTSSGMTAQAAVPASSTYSATLDGGSLFSWLELR